MTKLSAHFTDDEFKCPCCGVCQVEGKTLLALEELRTLVKKELGKETPLSVSSGYRCAKQNAKEGGGQSSQHLFGRAADVYCPKGLKLKRFYELADQIELFKNGGVGAYPAGKGQNTDFLHLDGRGTRARWSRINGDYKGIEEAWRKS